LNDRHKRTVALLKEPLLHFLLIGVALFLLFGWQGNPAPPMSGGPAGTPTTQIVVTADDLERMNTLFVKTWQRPPTEAEQKGLVADFVRNEIFYREALALGLDRDDEVLKRRLRQRMEFIYEDISSLTEPTDTELLTFMQTHSEKYLGDPQVAFSQVFVSRDKRGANADDDARKLLERLHAGADPHTAGDPTLLDPEPPLSALREISTQFGDAFGQSLLTLEPGRWVGPIPSAFGLHLVFVTERIEARVPDLNEIRAQVRQDWIFEKQKALKDAAYARIRERYAVTVAPPTPATAAALTDGPPTEVTAQ